MSSFLITGKSDKERMEYAKKQAQNYSRGVDLIEFDHPKSIAEAREITTLLTRKPYQSKKITIIFEADNLSPEAQNALLKTLEEPDPADIYILSHDPEKLLPTVRSRCLEINLGNPKTATEAQELLKAWSEYKKMKLSTLFDISGQTNINTWAEIFRQLLLFKLGGEKLRRDSAAELFTTEEDFKKVAASLDTQSIINSLRLAQEIKQKLPANVNAKLALENLMLSFPRPNSRSSKS